MNLKTPYVKYGQVVSVPIYEKGRGLDIVCI